MTIPEQRMSPNDKFYVQSINRALALVDTVAGHNRQGITATQLAEETGLPVCTVYRLVMNLLAWNYLAERDNGKYFLGFELSYLGDLVQRETHLVSLARPFLVELGLLTGQTIYLAVLDRNSGYIIYADKVISSGSIQLSAQIGSRNHIHSTANGKALVSGLPEAQVRELLRLSGLPPLTPATIIDPEQYLAEIERVRQQGYALDLEENEAKVVCIAAPIRNQDGEIIASVSISGVSGVTLTAEPREMASLAMETAGKVSRQLGYKGN